MKEIPILFSTPMVQAILEGRKTITRRIVEPQPIWSVDQDGNLYEGNHKGYVKVDGHPDWPNQFAYQFARWKKGDLLWVREGFRVNSWVPDDAELTFRYEADGAISPYMMVDPEGIDCDRFNKYWEQSCDDLAKAGYEPGEDERYADYDCKALRLRPNIFMLKEAARIWLKVESIRVERLQDISEEDARAEGVKPAHCESNEGCPSSLCKEKCAAIGEWWNYLAPDGEGFPAYSAKESFESLWKSINGTESWQANPWVWIISFKVLSTTGKP
jgi:hypothetical protein